ncbi:hypothetical protein BH10PAT1_BH10PAT1_1130 [soil metagenome]
MILFALFGPFLVWPFEYFFTAPYLIEEIFKVIVVYFFRKESYKVFVLSGILFALTETIFYSINIDRSGNINLLVTRFVATALLHSTTFLIIGYFAKRKNKFVIIIGGLAGILIHYLYNLYFA